MIIVTAESHLDHGLTLDHVRFLLEENRDKNGFFIRTVEMPAELPDLECRLYGPVMGDEPVVDAALEFRADRKYPSRTIARVARPTRLITVIAGPHAAGPQGEMPCVLYTAFGGPAAPREPGDPSLDGDAAALDESFAFWRMHALGTLASVSDGGVTTATPESAE